jgi:hypothetical protein
MKRILFAATVIALLAAPAAAQAKRLASATACGQSGCRSAGDPTAFMALLEGTPPTPGGLARAHSFYRLRVRVDEGQVNETMRLLVVPRGGYVRGPDGEWRQGDQGAVARVERLARDLKPFPPSQLPGVAHSPRASQPTAPAAAPAHVPADHESSFPWLLAAAIAAAMLITGGVAVRIRRSRELPADSVRRW